MRGEVRSFIVHLMSYALYRDPGSFLLKLWVTGYVVVRVTRSQYALRIYAKVESYQRKKKIFYLYNFLFFFFQLCHSRIRFVSCARRKSRVCVYDFTFLDHTYICRHGS